MLRGISENLCSSPSTWLQQDDGDDEIDVVKISIIGTLLLPR
jgi:hypothetical protein